MPTTTSTAISTPVIQVISPNGGEQWESGKTYTIQWSSQNIPYENNISILLVSGAATQQVIATTDMVSPGSIFHFWQIPYNIPTGNYKIKVVYIRSDSVYAADDYSDNEFTITYVAPPATPLSFTPNSIDNGQGSWQTAKTSCQNLGARLPTVAELNILYQQKTIYGLKEDAAYWSSEESENNAYYLSSSNGLIGTMNKSFTFPYFRCVKDGAANSTPFSSILDLRAKNLASILQLIGSLSETLEKLSQLLK